MKFIPPLVLGLLMMGALGRCGQQVALQQAQYNMTQQQYQQMEQMQQQLQFQEQQRSPLLWLVPLL